ncbi:MAG TPA: alpha-amylase family glycosyl hydrolase [bacterium]|nr:alpha-amylase family glycosyl hydrolase [bacterium]
MRTFRLIFLLVFAVVLLASGCGGDDDPSTSSGQADDDNDTGDDPADDDADDDDVTDDDDSVDADWYRRVVFMEIFVRSYADSDGDGIGDLPGLTARLPYLAQLGVGALWLTPIYPTPFVDSGYDVADYTAINPDYGTMDDFLAFLARAHELGLHVFLDGVFNHTSDRHEWFLASRSSRDDPKRDWYVWADEPLFRCPAEASGVEEMDWAYDEATGQYYWHHFRAGMPDLNWANPEVHEAIAEVMRFWLDLGVDGFRLDVAHLYYEDATTCTHHPLTHEIHSEFRALLDEYGDRAMVGELIGSPQEMAAYYGDGDDELHMVLNFNLTYALFGAHHLARPDILADTLDASLSAMPAGGQNTVFFSNHDFYRTFDLLLRDEVRMKQMAALQLALPGTPFIYYGEEVGMADGREVVTDYRDAARTPMHWTGDDNAGFTTGDPWINLAPNYRTHNVADEAGEPASLLNHYRRLLALRNATKPLQTGAYREWAAGDPLAFAFFRGNDERAVLAAFNFSSEPQTLRLNFAASPWGGLTGAVRDVIADEAYPLLDADNADDYRFALPGRGYALLTVE